jgi:4-hydroxy-tetrahydrodipicolinate synthase
MRLMGVAVKRSRVPVVFNCSHSTFDGAVELTQAADASGAAGALVMPPYFFRYSQEYLPDFYRQLVIEAEVSIPVLLYNIPQFTTGISFEVASTLLQEGVVQGIKDSSGDWELFEKLLRLRKEVEFSLLAGNDVIAARARGAACDGVISGIASAIPELLVALDRSISSGATEVQTRLEVRLRQFIEWADRFPAPIAVKEATAARGLKLGPHSLPCEGELGRQLDAFREWFTGWLPQMLSDCKHA